MRSKRTGTPHSRDKTAHPWSLSNQVEGIIYDSVFRAKPSCVTAHSDIFRAADASGTRQMMLATLCVVGGHRLRDLSRRTCYSAVKD
jgi:hypothetical protein